MATTKRARATSSTSRKKAAATSVQELTTQQPQVNHEEEIRVRAYQLFELRGRTHGFDIEDWLRAENEMTRHGARTA